MTETAVLLLFGGAAAIFMAWMSAVSVRERELRAARVSAALAVALPAPFVVAALAEFPGRDVAAWILPGLAIAAVLLWLVPVKGPRHPHAEARESIDERTVMFARRELAPGTARFDAYYDEFPAHRDPDDRWRARPGLLDREARHHHRRLFAAAEACNETIEALQSRVDAEAKDVSGDDDPAALTRFLAGWLDGMGVVSSGVAALRPEHWYARIGRREPYGAPAALPHERALVFAVEMDKDMLDRAPLAPAVAESSRRYLDAALIAVQAAALLRNLGHAARAHIDTDYRLVCPLVARDAGLGEIGRMGLLMTPELGPRVRLAAVSTDAPLVPSAPTRDESVQDFCAVCEKCADICPAAAIPAGPRRDHDGVLRWRIDQEKCFALWCAVGTDCGRCMQVCPYSHPDNALHRLVRAGVRRSAPFRRVALKLDDLFYGRRPPTRDLEDWMGQP